MKDDSLIIPLIFDSRQPDFLDKSFCSANHSTLVSWGFGEDEFRESLAVPPGIAIGCTDGSVFIFHAQEDKKRKRKPLETLNLSALQSPSSSGRRSTPSGSPSPLPSPGASSSKGPPKVGPSSLLTQPSRSRVVSGLSTKPAEAPKNYVDFEPEKDRLEGILRSSSSKNKSFLENFKWSPSAGSTTRLPDPIQAAHMTHSHTAPPSRASSPRNSISPPPSPTASVSKISPVHVSPFPTIKKADSPPQLQLKYHVFPHLFIHDNPLISLSYLPGGLLLGLLKNGTITAVDVASGICMTSLDLNNPPYFLPPPSMTSSSSIKQDTVLWNWTRVQAVEHSEYIIVMAVASNSTPISADREPGSHSRIAILQLIPLQHPNLRRREGMLNKVGEWIVENDSANYFILKDDYTSIIHLLTIESHTLLSQTLEIVPEAYTIAAPDSLQPSLDAISSTLVAPPTVPPPSFLAPLSLPFKPKEQSQANTPKAVSGRVLLGPPILIGDLPPLGGSPSKIHILDFNAKMARGCVFRGQEFGFFKTLKDSDPKITGHINHHHLTDVIGTTSRTVFLREERYVRAFTLPETWWDITEDFKLNITSSAELPTSSSLVAVLSSSYSICIDSNDSEESSVVSLRYIPFLSSRFKRSSKRLEHSPSKQRIAWSLDTEMRGLTSNRITSLLPLNNDLVVVGDSNGIIRKTSLTALMTTGLSGASDPSIEGLCASITSFHLTNLRGDDFIIGGLDDGGIAVWQLRSLKLFMRLTVFLEPLSSVIPINEERIGALQDCILCVSEDGTVVAINLVKFELLYMLPGSATSLTDICLSESNILLMYADGTSRMWDLNTQEFWRSMATRVALELVNQGGWLRFELSHKEPGLSPTSLTVLPHSWISNNAGATLLCDLHTLNDLIYPIAPSYKFKDPRVQETGVAVSENETRDAPPKRSPVRLKYIRSLVAALHTPGLNEEIDRICRDRLGVYNSKTTIGVYWGNHISTSNIVPSAEVWQISSIATASRLMALVALLRALANFEEYEVHANQIITFYVAGLSDIVGQSWQSPSLEFLGRYWFHHSRKTFSSQLLFSTSHASTEDIRMAARTLFGATIIRQPDADILTWIEFWQHELPCLQPDTEKQSNHSALALLISGNIAIERYSVISPSTLTDIAKSITLYLHDDECPHRALAIDLCSRGFQLWQNHVDAVEVLRSLFALATSADRERNVAPQARSAVLQIASGNTPLFMTTLLLDIIHPKSLQQRKSILQLVAFLIKKKPLVLYPNLPRLVEAVVRSLDPSSSGERNAVFDAATEILAQVVKFFPSADFHMASQRLCVGTSEGAVIMYDLKTATRLYVLEGHKKQIDISSFSPDGRRLVTVSTEERVAKIWKVGSSFVSLFTPGAPPRQGHAGSEPYRSVPFNFGEENLTPTGIFEHLRIEWLGDRSVRLKIKEIAFTFNT